MVKGYSKILYTFTLVVANPSHDANTLWKYILFILSNNFKLLCMSFPSYQSSTVKSHLLPTSNNSQNWKTAMTMNCWLKTECTCIRLRVKGSLFFRNYHFITSNFLICCINTAHSAAGCSQVQWTRSWKWHTVAVLTKWGPCTTQPGRFLCQKYTYTMQDRFQFKSHGRSMPHLGCFTPPPPEETWHPLYRRLGGHQG